MKPRSKASLLPLITIVTWSMAVGVLAFDKQDNWNVDGLHGGVRVNATLTDSACSLATGSEEQEIRLGAIPGWQLEKPGSLSEPVKFHLILEDCPVSDIVRATEHGDNVMWLPSQPVVMMNFIGVEQPGDPSLFQIFGKAGGVALRLEDAEHNQIHPGERTRPLILYPGRNDLTFDAQLSRTLGPLVQGDFHTVVNVGMEYH